MNPRKEFVQAVMQAVDKFNTQTGLSVDSIRFFYERMHESGQAYKSKVLASVELEAS